MTRLIILYILYILYIYSFRKEVIKIDIIISNASNQPIYDQVRTQIKANIISGQLAEGEMLPSIRALAKDLRISVITTKRAYDELEREGYINNVAGKGCFVAKRNLELVREEYLKKIEEHMQAAVELSSWCQLSEEDLTEMLHVIWKGETP